MYGIGGGIIFSPVWKSVKVRLYRGCTGEDAFTLFQGKHLQATERRQQGAVDRIRRTIPTCTTT